MFSINKVSAKRGYFTHTGVGSPNQTPRRVITATEIEGLAAEGLTRKQIAARLGLSYGYSNKRLNESHSLSQAYKRGKATYERSIGKI